MIDPVAGRETVPDPLCDEGPAAKGRDASPYNAVPASLHQQHGRVAAETNWKRHMTDAAIETLRFEPDGGIPNSRLPLVLLRAALPAEARRGEGCAALFARNGWRGTWVDGVYDFWHFHTRGHEVLGCVAGEARIGFGGDAGAAVTFSAGDVVVIAAGVGHRRLSASLDFRVVGAYPPGQEGEITRPGDMALEVAAERAASVPAPRTDPVSGKTGPLLDAWA